MRVIKAIIFDMDGVLIDAKDWHYEALNQALDIFGFEISRYDHLSTFDGLPTIKKLEMLSIDKGLPEGLFQLINSLKQKFTMEMIHTRCKPVFQHEYALSRLKREGFRLAVASNSVKQSIEFMMHYARLDTYLDFTISAEEVSAGKPDPIIYLNAISRLGLSPDECLIVEDNENGVKAAKASGAHVLVVSDTLEVSYDRISKEIRRIEKGMCN